MAKKLVPGFEKPTLTEDGRIAGVLDPTAQQDVATKDYVDVAVANQRWDYHFNAGASGLDSYYEMNPTPTGDSESTFTIPSSLGVGDGQAVFQWIADAVVPFTSIEQGVIDVHIHAQITGGNRNVVLYAEIYEYTSVPAEVLIATTEVSQFLTTTKTHYSFHATIVDDYEIAATSKLLVKILANVSGGGQNVTFALYAEGSTASRISTPVPTSILGDTYVAKSLFDAQTILQATTDNIPVALTVTEQTLVGRITSGNIAALSIAQVKTLLGAGAASGLATLNASTKVVEQPAAITDHLEDTPSESESTKAPTSTWAFLHVGDVDAHVNGATAGQLLVATAATTAAWQGTGVILSAPDISGSVTAASALTLPAFTAGGAVVISTNDGIDIHSGSDEDHDLITVLVTGTPRFYWDEGATAFRVTTDFRASTVAVTGAAGFWCTVSPCEISAYNSNDAYLMGKARDTDNTTQEVFRLQGAVIPYFSTGMSQEFKFYNDGTLEAGSYNIKIDAATNGIYIGDMTNSYDILLKYEATDFLSIRNDEDNAYAGIKALSAIFYGAGGFSFAVGASEIAASNANDAYVMGKARKNDDTLREIFRMFGGADPSFKIGNNGNAMEGTYGGLVGFFAATPVAQQTYPGAALNAAYGVGDLDTEGEIIAAINATNTMINLLRGASINLGMTAAS